MKNNNSVIVWVLSLVLATLVGLSIFFGFSPISVSSKGQYYSISLYYDDYKHQECEKILSEFALSQIDLKDISTASLVATDNGKAVMIITTNVNITRFAQEYYIGALSDRYSELKYIEVSDVVTADSLTGRIKQLWRLENDEVRVTAYKALGTRNYVLSVRLPIDKFEFAKQNGTKTSGFPMGKGEIKL